MDPFFGDPHKLLTGRLGIVDEQQEFSDKVGWSTKNMSSSHTC